VIQGVGAFDETVEIPLGLIMTEAGTHTIMLDDVENFNNPVYIKDTVLNMTYNLTEGNFSPAVPLGSYFDRFKLVFQPQTLNTDVFLENDTKVYYNSNNIIIKNPNSLHIDKVSILNELGQVIQTKKYGTNDNSILIPFKQTEGLYLINLESEGNISSFKILKY
jgi:hypothetical protein